MFKQILVPILGRRGDFDALNAAVCIGIRAKARVKVLQLAYMPTAFSSNWAAARKAGGVEVCRQVLAEAEADAARLRIRLEKDSVAHTVDVIETSFNGAADTVARHARCADLTVIAGALGDKLDAGTMHVFTASLFLASGGPVLVVQPRFKVAIPPRRVVVAWRSTREAARALHDAMPLLREAEVVELLIVTDSAGKRDDSPGEETISYLAQHGVEARLEVRDSRRKTTSAVVLDYVRQAKADLIVVGGYGHSRLRESVLGGVTRELLIAAPMPVLYSH